MRRRSSFGRLLIPLLVGLFIGLTFAAPPAAAQDSPAAQQLLPPNPSAPPADPPLTPDAPGAPPQAPADAAPVAAPPPPQPQTPPADSQTEDAPRHIEGDRFFHDFVGDFAHDEFHIWTGPFRPRNYDSHSMTKYGIPFFLISTALIATDTKTAGWLPNTTGQVSVSSRISQIGAPYSYAGFSLAAYLIGRAGHNSHLQETGFLALEAVVDSQIIALVLKEATQRQRPLQGTRHGGFWEGGGSFPSGHAAAAFAFAAVVSYEYRDHIAIPIAAYTVATVVDISRLGARQHWLSDLFVGSAMGFMTGRYVYKTHHNTSLPGTINSRLIPDFGFRENGLGLYWDF